VCVRISFVCVVLLLCLISFCCPVLQVCAKERESGRERDREIEYTYIPIERHIRTAYSTSSDIFQILFRSSKSKLASLLFDIPFFTLEKLTFHF